MLLPLAPYAHDILQHLRAGFAWRRYTTRTAGALRSRGRCWFETGDEEQLQLQVGRTRTPEAPLDRRAGEGSQKRKDPDEERER